LRGSTIKELTLTRCNQLSDKVVETIIQNALEIEKLVLTGAEITDATPKMLQKCPFLKHVSFQGENLLNFSYV
jgi:hypothetical protein